MKRTVTAIATAAALFAAAPAALAMQEELGMLTQAVTNGLETEGFDTGSVDNLTLGEIAQIRTFLNGEEGMGRDAQIQRLLDRAADR